MPGVTPSKRAQTNPKSILQRPQGSQKKNMSPGARSPGQGGRFGRTSPPATPQRGNSSPATGKGAGKSPGGEQLVALSRARQAMGLVEKTMLNSEPEEKILPPGTDQEGALAWVKEGGVVTELATKEAEPTDVEAAKYISDTLVAQDPATIMVALKTRAALWAAAREIIDEGGNATLQHADSRLAVALSATALHSHYTAGIDAAAPKAGSSKKLTVALAYGTADSAVAAHLDMEYEDALRLCGRSILKEDDEKRINKIFDLVLAITPTEAAKRVQRDAKGNPTTSEGKAKLAECIDLEAARMREPHALIREHAAKRMRAFMQIALPRRPRRYQEVLKFDRELDTEECEQLSADVAPRDAAGPGTAAPRCPRRWGTWTVCHASTPARPMRLP